MATNYYVLCQRGNESSELTRDGQSLIYPTKKAAQQAAAYMRLLMEGGEKVTYTVRSTR